MKIVYFNYLQSAIGPIIRTLELAKGCADNGISVSLHFMHPGFAPPPFVYERIKAYRSGRLQIAYDTTHERSLTELDGNQSAGANPSPGEPRMRLKGLLKQSLLSLGMIPAELKIVRQENPDAVLARPDHAFSFCFSTWLAGVPLVLDTDGPVEELDIYWGISSRWLKVLDTFRASRADSVLVVSRVCAELWRGKISRLEKIFIAPNGTHPEEFSPLASEEREARKDSLGLSGCRVIGYSGNQRVWHGLPNLLSAALPLLREDSNLKILVIGCGRNEGLQKLCGVPEQIFSRQIVFTGRLSYWDMAAHIDLSDIMVMPYAIIDLFFFSPMRMFEAMSVGKSIVTSRQGQMMDILDDRSSVRFFNPNVTGSLTQQLASSIRDDEFIAAGTRNRAYLMAEHTWSHRGRVVGEAVAYAMAKRRKGGG